MDFLAAPGLKPTGNVLQEIAADANAASNLVLSENVGEVPGVGLPQGVLVARNSAFERRFLDLRDRSPFIHNPLAPERGSGSVPYREDLERFIDNSLTGMVARGSYGGIGNCYQMSATLAAELSAKGINYERIVNQGTSYGTGGGEEGPGFGHAYVKVKTPGRELIVDPTIGQFFTQSGSPNADGTWSNTPDVFIGTRAELIAAFQKNMSRAGSSVQEMGAEAFVKAMYGPPDAKAVQQVRPLDRSMIRDFQQLRQDFERSR